METTDIEEAIKIVGPVAAMVGLTEDDTRNVVNYIDKMSQRGISGRDAGMALRVWLKNEKEKIMPNLYTSMSAEFSADKAYRYVLRRWWDDSKPYIMFIGLNPSTADDKEDDPTIRRCVQFAKSWGYGGLCMANLFAYRATKPIKMLASYTPIGVDNDIWLKRLTLQADKIVAAWGVHGNHKNRDKAVMSFIPDLYCLGITKNGHPKHPLFLKKNTKLIKLQRKNNGT